MPTKLKQRGVNVELSHEYVKRWAWEGRTVAALEDSPYVFSATDFGFDDPNDNPANNLLAVEIKSLPTAGNLMLFGTPVLAGQFVAATDIDAGGLIFTAASNASGTSYAAFTFQVQDDGGTAAGGRAIEVGVSSLD